MKSKISDFKASFSDLLRPNLYSIYITPKKKFFGDELETIGMLCHEATFPYMTFNTNTFWYDNRPREYVNSIDFDPATFVFYVDKDSIILPFFEKWRNEIYDSETRQLGFYDDYISTIQIELFDRQLNTVGIAVLHEAFPANFQSISLGYGQNDTVMTFTASFKFADIDYEYYTAPKQQSVGLGGITSLKDLLTRQNLEKGVSMVRKLERMREQIKNGRTYDIQQKAIRVLNVDKNLAGTKIPGTEVNIDENLLKRASRLF